MPTRKQRTKEVASEQVGTNRIKSYRSISLVNSILPALGVLPILAHAAVGDVEASSAAVETLGAQHGALIIAALLVCAGLAFLLSASAGLGGSLLLVPVFALLLGPKQGIALAALLLMGNNI